MTRAGFGGVCLCWRKALIFPLLLFPFLLYGGELQSGDIRYIEWQLVAPDGNTVAATGHGRIHIILQTGDRMSGFAGCNRMRGHYQADSEHIHFSKIAATMKVCADAADSEHNFIAALEKSRFYRREDNHLDFFDAHHQRLLSFIAANTPEPRTYVFTCEKGYHFVARIEHGDAWLFLPERTLRLSETAGGTGAVYSDGQNRFAVNGDNARLRFHDTEYAACANNRSAAIWEHAKLNGIDFRAVGHEPPWVLQFTKGQKIVLQLGYGKSELHFPATAPVTDTEERSASYSTDNSQHTLSLTLTARECHDSMTSASYGTTVHFILDGKEQYVGCGRFLH